MTWLQRARGCATPNDADESRAGWQTDATVDAKWSRWPRRVDDGTFETWETVCAILIPAIESGEFRRDATPILDFQTFDIPWKHTFLYFSVLRGINVSRNIVDAIYSCSPRSFSVTKKWLVGGTFFLFSSSDTYSRSMYNFVVERCPNTCIIYILIEVFYNCDYFSFFCH